MRNLKTSLVTNRDLTAGESYEVAGTYDDMSGETYYLVKLDERIVLYHISDFKLPVVVDDDEF